MKLVWAALIALAAFALPSPAHADERILRFVSDVQVNKDSSLDVTETIDVRAENVEIEHGIFRDFPTRYRTANGGRMRVGFTLGPVTRNGIAEPAKVEPIANGVRIRIGDADTTVPPGDHRYVIRYRTTRQIGRFKSYDELYWNATGNGWAFPIDEAEAIVRLPSAVPLSRPSFYTGPQESKGADARITAQEPGRIHFATTRPLGPHEGLTIAVAFPKNVVAGASDADRTAWWLADYGPLIVGGAALLGLVIFYYVAWQRAGRDPRAGTVVPIFSPPDELTPAAMRYVWKMGADNRAFAAALVDMGVRGHLRMVEQDGGWFSRDKTRLERVAGDPPLPPDEEAALRELAMTGESIVMEQKNHAKFSAAQKGLEAALKEKYEGRLFNKNWGWAIAGVILLVAAIWLAAAAVVVATNGAEIWQVGVSAGSLALAALLVALTRESSSTGKCLLTLGAFVAGAFALTTGAPIIGAAINSGWWQPLAIPLLALPLVISAFVWIDAPTREGRAVLDRVMGFRHYLSITERERLDRMHPPEDTPELFERFLPYAIALGVENRWARRFADVLAAASAQGQQGFGWYSGSGHPWSNPTAFASSMGSSLASAVSSASTAPGSSSGSGGGGSSGGGGGGGGGGGW